MVAYAFPTAREIVTGVQTVIGEVAGAGVQLFTEDALLAHLQRTFNLVFIKYPWKRYTASTTITLDGVTGRCTEEKPFEAVRGEEDIIGVYRENEGRQLPMAPARINPKSLGSGNKVMYWTEIPVSEVADFQNKRLQFYPLSSVGFVDVTYRLHPGRFVWESKIYIDQDLLEYGTAWQALEDEGTNPAGAGKAQTLFDLRWRDLMKAFGDHPNRIVRGDRIPTQWHEPPD